MAARGTRDAKLISEVCCRVEWTCRGAVCGVWARRVQGQQESIVAENAEIWPERIAIQAINVGTRHAFTGGEIEECACCDAGI